MLCVFSDFNELVFVSCKQKYFFESLSLFFFFSNWGEWFKWRALAFKMTVSGQNVCGQSSLFWFSFFFFLWQGQRHSKFVPSEMAIAFWGYVSSHMAAECWSKWWELRGMKSPCMLLWGQRKVAFSDRVSQLTTKNTENILYSVKFFSRSSKEAILSGCIEREIKTF